MKTMNYRTPQSQSWHRSEKHRCLCASLLVLAFATFGPISMSGVGFRLPNQDPEAIARGNAFVATADNPSAIYYNPAGITQLEGQSIQAGMYLLDVNVSQKLTGGVETDNKSGIQPVPQLYYAYSPKDLPLSFGLGIYAPYGLSMEWPEDSPFRTMAIKGKLVCLSINPVVAWKVHPKLSLGIGPTFNLSEAELTQGINLVPGLTPNDLFHLKGDGFTVGFNAGLLWQPHEKWFFGVQYRFPTTVKYSGHSEYTSGSEFVPNFSSQNTSAEIRFPQHIVAGLSFRPTAKWNLEFDLDWTDWDYVNQIPLNNTALGNQSLVFNWKSSFMYEFGATRDLGNGYFVSAGYFYSENSVPDQTFIPLVPDTNLHLGSVGFGHRGTRWDWTVAYHFALGDRVVVNGDPLANGNYDIFNQALNVALRLKF